MLALWRGAGALPGGRGLGGAYGQHAHQGCETVRHVAAQHVLADGEDRAGQVLVGSALEVTGAFELTRVFLS